jgi:hypothetical protein
MEVAMPVKLVPNTRSARGKQWILYAIILLSVVLGAVVLRLAADLGTRRAPSQHDGADSLIAVDAVYSFAGFVAEQRPARDAQRFHEHTAEGMRLLGAALFIIANRENVSTRSAGLGAELLQAADLIEQAGGSTNHADVARAMFVMTGTALSEIQRLRYPQLAGAVQELRIAASELRTDRQLNEQADAVRRFFDRASETLRGMAAVGL